MTRAHAFNPLPWSGIAAGPAAWALTFAVNYTLVPWQCAHKLYPAPVISLAGIVVALAGAYVSYLAWSAPDAGSAPPEHLHTRRFLAGIDIAAGCLFALVIAMQFAAGLVFEGCEG